MKYDGQTVEVLKWSVLILNEMWELHWKSIKFSLAENVEKSYGCIFPSLSQVNVESESEKIYVT